MGLGDTKAFSPNARTFGRNTIINFVGQVLVALSAIIMVPYIVRVLGYSAYGLLSIALVAFGSFSLLELGLGRATTKYVAEYLCNKRYEKISAVVWTSLLIQLLIGLLGGAILAIFTKTIVRKLSLQLDMTADATNVFYILAISAPLILGSSALRGALEGSQRFDLVNYVKITLNISTYLIPLIGACFNLNVPSIVFFMFIARLMATVAYFTLCIHTLPQLRNISIFKGKEISTLFSFAGWVALSNLIVPFLVQLDRFFIAALVSITAVTYYTVPFEIMNGLWIIPGSITAVLFPAFSGANQDKQLLNDLFSRPAKYILILLGPITIVMAFFSRDILFLWQGPTISENSAVVLQVLLLGVLINSMSWVPSNLLMGLGRPDITAKIHLIQTPLYLALVYFFILKWGVLGAAAAFTLRVLFETILTYYAVFYLKPDLRDTFLSKMKPSIFTVFTLFSLFVLQKKILSISFCGGMSFALLILCGYLLISWSKLLDQRDRIFLSSLITRGIKIT